MTTTQDFTHSAPKTAHPFYVETYNWEGNAIGALVGHVIEATSADRAERRALEAHFWSYPDNGVVEVFVTRALTPERALEIRAAFDDHTWDGSQLS